MKNLHYPTSNRTIPFLFFALLYVVVIPISNAEQIKFTMPFDVDHENHKILKVVDASTLELSNHQQVRLQGVNLQSYLGMKGLADAAIEFIRVYMLGEEVIVKYGKRSDLKRGENPEESLVYIYRASDGLFLNEELIKRGLAVVSQSSDFEYYQKFKFYEKKAKKYRRGTWA